MKYCGAGTGRAEEDWKLMNYESAREDVSRADGRYS
jgi:hypothetical protein